MESGRLLFQDLCSTGKHKKLFPVDLTKLFDLLFHNNTWISRITI